MCDAAAQLDSRIHILFIMAVCINSYIFKKPV